MAQSKVNLPPVGTGDTGPIPVAVKKISTGENVQQVELGTAVEGGALTPIANANPLPISDAGGSLTVDGTVTITPSGTQTVSGTVTANIGTSGSLALDATLTGGTQKSKLIDSAGTNAAAVSAAGRLSVDASGVAVPVTDNSGSLTVDAPVGTPAFVRLSDGSAAITTLPVSAASLPLPTGAATAAKQPALGTAGSPASDVITVQGNASGTPIPVSGTFSASGTTDLTASGSITGSTQTVSIATLNGMSTVAVDVSGTFSATLNPQGTIDGTNWFNVMAGFDATQSTGLADATQQITAAGRRVIPVTGYSGFRIRCSAYVSGTAVIALRASAATGVVEVYQTGHMAITDSAGNVAGVAGSLALQIDQTSIRGNNTASDNGVSGAGVQRVTIASDSTGQVKLATGANTIGALTANQTVNQAQVAGTAVDTNSGNKSAGTQRIVLATDQPQLTNALKVDGSAVVQPISGSIGVTGSMPIGVSTTGGATPSSATTGTSKVAAKASAGSLYGWHIFNANVAVAYVQIFDVASGSVTLGTTAPTLSLGIPGGGGATVSIPSGIAFATAITYACTTTRSGSSAPVSTVDVNLWYA